MPTTKNIIIFTAIATALILIYVFFIKKAPDTATLITSTPAPFSQDTGLPDPNSAIAKDFLTLLLSVKNIKLDDAIFSDNAFSSLRDSSITLIPDGNEGRMNPFAPFGTDSVALPTKTENPSINTGASTLP